MYIDKEIIIDTDSLPKKIQEFIKEMETAYEKDDYSTYLLTQEIFEPAVKQYCMTNRIPRNVGFKLLEKYS